MTESSTEGIWGAAPPLVPIRDGDLELRLLTEHELHVACLPLRWRVLHVEHRHTFGPIRSAADLYDEYDARSTVFGVFHSHELVASARLIDAGTSGNYPSAAFLRGMLDEGMTNQRLGEVSRAVVEPRYRGLGLFRVLMITAVLAARDSGMGIVVVSEEDRAAFARFMQALRFTRVRRGYLYRDQKLKPAVLSTSFVLDIPEALTGERRRALRFERDQALRQASERCATSCGAQC